MEQGNLSVKEFFGLGKEKTDTTNKYLETIDYGNVVIRYDKTFLDSKVIDIIETSSGENYEIRKNQNGKLVAIKIED